MVNQQDSGRCLSSQAALPPSGLSRQEASQAKPAAANAAEALRKATNLRCAGNAAGDPSVREVLAPKIAITCERTAEWIESIAAYLDENNVLLQDAWGALNFILAFYEPGQRYLDTEAWKTCEAGARDVHKRLAQAIEARRAATAKTDAVEDESAVAASDAPDTSQGPNP